ncbi:MAG: hypothetical protein ABFR90_07415 [Planctomycetota bacterium]
MRLPNPLWYFVVLIAILLLAVMIPVFSRTKEIAQRVVCESNLKKLSKVMTIYAGDYNTQYPMPSEKWCDILLGIKSFKEKRGLSADTFRCPADPKGSFSYAVNEDIYKTEWHTCVDYSMVLMFESNLGRNGVGGQDDVILHHNKEGQLGCHIVFGDGYVKFVTEDHIDNLNWSLEAASQNATMKSQQFQCQKKLQSLSKSMGDYVSHSEALLPTEKWCDLLMSKTDISWKRFECPTPDETEKKCYYAMNKNIAGINISTLSLNTVLFFDSDLEWNGLGGLDDVVFRHTDRPHDYLPGTWRPVCNVVFIDGHIGIVTEDKLGDLQWTVE